MDGEVREGDTAEKNWERSIGRDRATCKVFLDAAHSSAVYKVTSMAEIPVVFSYDMEDRPEDVFLFKSARVGNPAAIFRIGMTEFFWMGREVGGCDTLLEAADAGDVQGRYMCAMLLLMPGVGDEADAGKGVEMYADVLAAGKIELCRELFGQLFANPLIGVHPSDPGKPIVCRSSVCPRRGTMGAANDSSSVSCVQCLAEFEYNTRPKHTLPGRGGVGLGCLHPVVALTPKTRDFTCPAKRRPAAVSFLPVES
ncbi:hypothetical protein HN873_015795 [Arachis hypogaea]